MLVARSLIWYVRFVRRLPAGRPADESWVRQWESMLAAEGIRQPIPLRMTVNLGPVLCRMPNGWRLFLPAELWRALGPDGRLAILRHELAHLKRHDTWKSLVVRLVALPHWFNPAAWWAVRKFEEAAEWACDVEATGPHPDHAVEYARTLLKLGTPSTRPLSYSPAAQGRGLSIRVRRLLTSRTLEDSVMKKLLIVTVALGLVVACLLHFDLVAKESTADGTAGGVRATGQPAESKPLEGMMMSGGMGSENMMTSGMMSGGMPGGGMEIGHESAAMGGFPAKGPSGLVNQKMPIGALRYDGRSFEEWRDEWKMELKPERRAEAINAFAAFGANGYGEEAAEAILEVMRGLEITLGDASFSESSFKKGAYVGNRLVKKSAIAAFLPVLPAYRIPPEDATKVLSRELEIGNRNGRLFAIFALQNMGQDAKAAIPALRETFEADDEVTVRRCAHVAAANIAPEVQISPSTLRGLLKGPDADALDKVLMILVPQTGASPSSIFQTKPGVAEHSHEAYGGMEGYEDMYGGGMGSYIGYASGLSGPPRELRPSAEPIVRVLIEALDSEHAAVRREVTWALARVGPEADGVMPALIGAFEKADSSDRHQIVVALENCARMLSRPKSGLRVARQRPALDENPSAAEFKPVISKLIQALDPRDPADLGLLGSIYVRFGPTTEEAMKILQNAAQDEDEEVRRAATEVLEAIAGRKKAR